MGAEAAYYGTAEVKKGVKKKLWPGQTPDEYFYFTLIGVNGEPVAQSEQYTQKHNVMSVLYDYFPTFEVVDLT